MAGARSATVWGGPYRPGRSWSVNWVRQQSFWVSSALPPPGSLNEPRQLRSELSQAIEVGAVERDALDTYGHGATSHSGSTCCCTRVSQPPEARKRSLSRVAPALVRLDPYRLQDPSGEVAEPAEGEYTGVIARPAAAGRV